MTKRVPQPVTGAVVFPGRVPDGSEVETTAARAGGWYAAAEVPAAVRSEFDRLTVRVDRDRRWAAAAPRRRLPPVVTLPALVVAGAAGVVSGNMDAVLLGSLVLMSTPVLGFVPVRRVQRRWRLRRLTRRWGAHRVPRSAVGPRWQPTLDALAQAERSLRTAGLLEEAAAAGDGLGSALDRAVAGTRVEAEMARIGAAIDAGDPGDRDVGILREELVRAGGTRDALLAANAAAARAMVQLTAAAGSAAAAGTAAVTAARERALGGLGDAVAEAEALLPRDPTFGKRSAAALPRCSNRRSRSAPRCTTTGYAAQRRTVHSVHRIGSRSRRSSHGSGVTCPGQRQPLGHNCSAWLPTMPDVEHRCAHQEQQADDELEHFRSPGVVRVHEGQRDGQEAGGQEEGRDPSLPLIDREFLPSSHGASVHDDHLREEGLGKRSVALNEHLGVGVDHRRRHSVLADWPVFEPHRHLAATVETPAPTTELKSETDPTRLIAIGGVVGV